MDYLVLALVVGISCWWIHRRFREHRLFEQFFAGFAKLDQRIAATQEGVWASIAMQRLDQDLPNDQRLHPMMAQWQVMGWNFLGVYELSVGIIRTTIIAYLRPDGLAVGLIEAVPGRAGFEAIALAEDGAWLVCPECRGEAPMPEAWRVMPADDPTAAGAASCLAALQQGVPCRLLSQANFVEQYTRAQREVIQAAQARKR